MQDFKKILALEIIIQHNCLMKKINSVCVYCGSRPGSRLVFKETAIELGAALAQNGVALVYGGGDSGIMGFISQATRQAGGNVLGIIPEFLLEREAADSNPYGRDDVIITQTMHERKKLLFEKADAFIALPGGIGTLEELTEITTWAQLNRHSKPIIIANIAGFWQPLIDLLRHMESSGFIHDLAGFSPLIAKNVPEIIKILRN